MLWMISAVIIALGLVTLRTYAHPLTLNSLDDSIDPAASEAGGRSGTTRRPASKYLFGDGLGLEREQVMIAQGDPDVDQPSLFDDLLRRLERRGLEDELEQSTRSALGAGWLEPFGYGLYSYLLFGSASNAGRDRRVAAARAYCADIPPISDPALEGVPKSRINIVHVFSQIEYCPDAERLVDNYDYVRARRMMVEDLGIFGDGVYLVSYSEPILRVGRPDPNEMLVVDLSTIQEGLVEAAVLEFRRLTRRAQYWRKWDVRHFVFQLRVALPYLGELIKFGTAAAGERGDSNQLLPPPRRR